jgi:hypothetical protein
MILGPYGVDSWRKRTKGRKCPPILCNQLFAVEKTNMELRGPTVAWTEGRVLRIIPTVETTTNMKEMKETACWQHEMLFSFFVYIL